MQQIVNTRSYKWLYKIAPLMLYRVIAEHEERTYHYACMYEHCTTNRCITHDALINSTKNYIFIDYCEPVSFLSVIISY